MGWGCGKAVGWFFEVGLGVRRIYGSWWYVKCRFVCMCQAGMQAYVMVGMVVCVLDDVKCVAAVCGWKARGGWMVDGGWWMVVQHGGKAYVFVLLGETKGVRDGNVLPFA